MKLTDASHNLLFRLDPDAWRHDLALSGTADLVGYSEASRPAVRKTLASWCEAEGRGLYLPDDCDNPVSWDAGTFEPIDGERGVVEVHGRHPTVRLNPGRDFAWVGLRHRASGKAVLRVNVHATSGALKPQARVRWGRDLSAWKDWAIQQYWLDLLAFTAEQMSREVWDAILCGGDFNGRLENRDEWFHPGSLLRSLYRFDETPHSIDRLIYTVDSDVRQVRRWARSKGVRSDHALHFADYRSKP